MHIDGKRKVLLEAEVALFHEAASTKSAEVYPRTSRAHGENVTKTVFDTDHRSFDEAALQADGSHDSIRELHIPLSGQGAHNSYRNDCLEYERGSFAGSCAQQETDVNDFLTTTDVSRGMLHDSIADESGLDEHSQAKSELDEREYDDDSQLSDCLEQYTKLYGERPSTVEPLVMAKDCKFREVYVRFARLFRLTGKYVSEEERLEPVVGESKIAAVERDVRFILNIYLVNPLYHPEIQNYNVLATKVEGEDDWHKALQRLPWCPHTQRVEESRRLAAMSQCTGLELREAAAHGLWEMSVLQKHHEVFLQSPEVFPALLRGLRCELPNVLEFTTGAVWSLSVSARVRACLSASGVVEALVWNLMWLCKLPLTLLILPPPTAGASDDGSEEDDEDIDSNQAHHHQHSSPSAERASASAGDVRVPLKSLSQILARAPAVKVTRSPVATESVVAPLVHPLVYPPRAPYTMSASASTLATIQRDKRLERFTVGCLGVLMCDKTTRRRLLAMDPGLLVLTELASAEQARCVNTKAERVMYQTQQVAAEALYNVLLREPACHVGFVENGGLLGLQAMQMSPSAAVNQCAACSLALFSRNGSGLGMLESSGLGPSFVAEQLKLCKRSIHSLQCMEALAGGEAPAYTDEDDVDPAGASALHKMLEAAALALWGTVWTTLRKGQLVTLDSLYTFIEVSQEALRLSLRGAMARQSLAGAAATLAADRHHLAMLVPESRLACEDARLKNQGGRPAMLSAQVGRLRCANRKDSPFVRVLMAMAAAKMEGDEAGAHAVCHHTRCLSGAALAFMARHDEAHEVHLDPAGARAQEGALWGPHRPLLNLHNCIPLLLRQLPRDVRAPTQDMHGLLERVAAAGAMFLSTELERAAFPDASVSVIQDILLRLRNVPKDQDPAAVESCSSWRMAHTAQYLMATLWCVVRGGTEMRGALASANGAAVVLDAGHRLLPQLSHAQFMGDGAIQFAEFQIVVVWLLLGDVKDVWLRAQEQRLASSALDPAFAVEDHSVWAVPSARAAHPPHLSPDMLRAVNCLVEMLNLPPKRQFHRIHALCVRAIWELTSPDVDGGMKSVFRAAEALPPMFSLAMCDHIPLHTRVAASACLEEFIIQADVLSGNQSDLDDCRALCQVVMRLLRAPCVLSQVYAVRAITRLVAFDQGAAKTVGELGGVRRLVQMLYVGWAPETAQEYQPPDAQSTAEEEGSRADLELERVRDQVQHKATLARSTFLAYQDGEIEKLEAIVKYQEPWARTPRRPTHQLFVLQALVNLCQTPDNQVRMVKHGVYTLLRLRLQDAATADAQQCVGDILRMCSRHPKNAQSLYEAEMRCKVAVHQAADASRSVGYVGTPNLSTNRVVSEAATVPTIQEQLGFSGHEHVSDGEDDEDEDLLDMLFRADLGFGDDCLDAGPPQKHVKDGTVEDADVARHSNTGLIRDDAAPAKDIKARFVEWRETEVLWSDVGQADCSSAVMLSDAEWELLRQQGITHRSLLAGARSDVGELVAGGNAHNCSNWHAVLDKQVQMQMKEVSTLQRVRATRAAVQASVSNQFVSATAVRAAKHATAVNETRKEEEPLLCDARSEMAYCLDALKRKALELTERYAGTGSAGNLNARTSTKRPELQSVLEDALDAIPIDPLASQAAAYSSRPSSRRSISSQRSRTTVRHASHNVPTSTPGAFKGTSSRSQSSAHDAGSPQETALCREHVPNAKAPVAHRSRLRSSTHTLQRARASSAGVQGPGRRTMRPRPSTATTTTSGLASGLGSSRGGGKPGVKGERRGSGVDCVSKAKGRVASGPLNAAMQAPSSSKIAASDTPRSAHSRVASGTSSRGARFEQLPGGASIGVDPVEGTDARARNLGQLHLNLKAPKGAFWDAATGRDSVTRRLAGGVGKSDNDIWNPKVHEYLYPASTAASTPNTRREPALLITPRPASARRLVEADMDRRKKAHEAARTCTAREGGNDVEHEHPVETMENTETSVSACASATNELKKATSAGGTQLRLGLHSDESRHQIVTAGDLTRRFPGVDVPSELPSKLPGSSARSSCATTPRSRPSSANSPYPQATHCARSTPLATEPTVSSPLGRLVEDSGSERGPRDVAKSGRGDAFCALERMGPVPLTIALLPKSKLVSKCNTVVLEGVLENDEAICPGDADAGGAPISAADEVSLHPPGYRAAWAGQDSAECACGEQEYANEDADGDVGKAVHVVMNAGGVLKKTVFRNSGIRSGPSHAWDGSRSRVSSAIHKHVEGAKVCHHLYKHYRLPNGSLAHYYDSGTSRTNSVNLPVEEASCRPTSLAYMLRDALPGAQFLDRLLYPPQWLVESGTNPPHRPVPARAPFPDVHTLNVMNPKNMVTGWADLVPFPLRLQVRTQDLPPPLVLHPKTQPPSVEVRKKQKGTPTYIRPTKPKKVAPPPPPQEEEHDDEGRWLLERSVFWPRVSESDPKYLYNTPEAFYNSFQVDWGRLKKRGRFIKMIEHEVNQNAERKNAMARVASDSEFSDSDEDNAKAPAIQDQPVDVKGDAKVLLYLLYQTMRRHYLLIYSSFSYYAALGKGDPNSIMLNVYTEFLEDCRIPSKKSMHYNRAACDTLFIVVNKGDSANGSVRKAGGSDIALLRHEFMEVLIRLAKLRYGMKPSPSGKFNNLHECLELLLDERLDRYLPDEARTLSNDFRGEAKEAWNKKHASEMVGYQWKLPPARLYCEEMDLLYKEHLATLKAIFAAFQKLDKRDFRTSVGLTRPQWIELAHYTGMMDKDFSLREANLCFVWSRMLVVNEIKHWQKAQAMSFVDFLECLGRVADCKCIPRTEDLVEAGYETLSQYLQALMMPNSTVDVIRRDSTGFLTPSERPLHSKVSLLIEHMYRALTNTLNVVEVPSHHAVVTKLKEIVKQRAAA